MQMCAGFDMHDQSLATSLDITLGHHIGCEHHEVCFKRNLGERTRAGNDIGTKREVGNKLSIHHIPLNEIDAGFIEGNHCFTQL